MKNRQRFQSPRLFRFLLRQLLVQAYVLFQAEGSPPDEAHGLVVELVHALLEDQDANPAIYVISIVHTVHALCIMIIEC